MPISVTGTNPIVVTGTTANTSALITAARREIQQIVWVQPGANGHELKITDAANNVLAHFYCDSANSSQQLFLKITVTGLYAYNLPSGTLYIY